MRIQSYEDALQNMKEKLAAAGLYPLKAEAELSVRVLKERLEKILPLAMKEAGVELWAVIARENNEDPTHKLFYTWDSPLARRVSIMLFYRSAADGAVKKYYLGMACPLMAQIYENPMRKGESVWEAAARVVRELDPKVIAVNRSRTHGFCDGISSTLFEEFQEAIGPFAERIVDGEALCTGYLERVTPLEKDLMKVLTSVTQDVIEYNFSRAVITPGVTTTDDVAWSMRQMIHDLGFDFWFGPDVNLQRRGDPTVMIEGVILPGDLLHCDIGLNGKFVRLHTDMQWLAYILREDETEAPAEFCRLLDQGNRFRQIVMDNMIPGRDGNQIFEAAMTQGKAENLRPWLYSHAVGTFGHGAGPNIGMYDNQGFVPVRGEEVLVEDMVYALELNVCTDLALWDGQTVYAYLEENICEDADGVTYLAKQQKELLLV